MGTDVVFSDSDIEHFCGATGDTNALHNSAFMRQHGKLAFVPGMMTLLYAVNLASTFLTDGCNLYAHFGSPLFSGEKAVIYAKTFSPGEYRLYAMSGGSDLLSSNSGYSGIMIERKEHVEVQGIERKLAVSQSQLIDFSVPIRVGNNVSNLLFAVAYSSRALLEGLMNPKGEGEENVHEWMEGRLPVYASLSLQVERILIPKGELAYVTNAEASGKRDLVCRVSCSHAGNRIYTATYAAKAIAERTIIGMARNI
ncbi:MaoC family dehydratase [Candidatus Woesearchaeota archaeon]|nr:MaoC family dehydratase [Candidatus Woesearchaeota archaeon]